MARYNKYNHRIKYNHKLSDGGGRYNFKVFGIIGTIAITLITSVKPHLRRPASAVINIGSSLSGIATRRIHQAVNILMSLSLVGDAIRIRRAHATSSIITSLGASAKRFLSSTAALNFVLGLIARLRQQYRPVYPRLSVTEYPVAMSYTEYPIIMEVMGMPKAGSTITLVGTFPTSAGNLAQLEDVTVKIYGPGKTLLETITNVTLVSTGVYSVDYTIPVDKIGQFDFEFSGTLGSKTIIGRSSFESIWK
jgi:hypothetical protein